METHAFDLYEGMDVLDMDGEKIGSIVHIFAGLTDRAIADREHEAGAEPTEPAFDTGPIDDVQLETVQVTEMPVSFDALSESGAAQAVGETAADGVPASPLSDEVLTSSPTMSGLPANTAATASASRYFEVHHGGLLGLGGQSLYIPFEAVDTVTPGECVTLTCSREECAALYEQKPADLDEI